jgi:hypothetical protein
LRSLVKIKKRYTGKNSWKKIQETE